MHGSNLLQQKQETFSSYVERC